MAAVPLWPQRSAGHVAGQACAAPWLGSVQRPGPGSQLLVTCGPESRLRLLYLPPPLQAEVVEAVDQGVLLGLVAVLGAVAGQVPVGLGPGRALSGGVPAEVLVEVVLVGSRCPRPLTHVCGTLVVFRV